MTPAVPHSVTGCPSGDVAGAGELYEIAKRKDVPGRSKMGRDELARAVGKQGRPELSRKPLAASSVSASR